MKTDGNDHLNGETKHDERGGTYSNTPLTKREYFAAMAMQSCIYRSGWTPPLVAKDAILYADALIKELNKECVNENE